jgi:hypothetical protein
VSPSPSLYSQAARHVLVALLAIVRRSSVVAQRELGAGLGLDGLRRFYSNRHAVIRALHPDGSSNGPGSANTRPILFIRPIEVGCRIAKSERGFCGACSPSPLSQTAAD